MKLGMYRSRAAQNHAAFPRNMGLAALLLQHKKEIVLWTPESIANWTKNGATPYTNIELGGKNRVKTRIFAAI